MTNFRKDTFHLKDVIVFNELHTSPCKETGCKDRAKVVVALLNDRQLVTRVDLCADHATEHVASEPRRPFSTPFSRNRDGFLAVDLSLVALSEDGSLSFLRDVSGNVNVPVFSDVTEGMRAMQRFFGSKPGVFNEELHKVFIGALRQLGARPDSVAISDVAQSDGQHYFCSFASLIHGNTQLALQVRPSDAIAIALYGSLPIFATDKVIRHVKSYPSYRFPWDTSV